MGLEIGSFGIYESKIGSIDIVYFINGVLGVKCKRVGKIFTIEKVGCLLIHKDLCRMWLDLQTCLQSTQASESSHK